MEQQSDKPPPVSRAARPLADVDSQLAGRLDQALRQGAPHGFAGLIRAEDGAIEVLVTADAAAIRNIIREVVAEVVPVNQSGTPIRVVDGHAHSLAQLEPVFGAVRMRAADLKASGIKLNSFGVDIRNNMVRIGVGDLTPETKTFLEREFGPDKVNVCEEGPWFAYGPGAHG